MLKVDAIKIDVQGFEPEALLGLAEVLARDRPIIWCEIGGGTLSKINSLASLAELIPFEFNCLRFDVSSGVLGRSVTLTDVRASKLIDADYLIVPKVPENSPHT